MINLGTKSQVPIISYSATSPFLSSLGSPYFIRATQNDVTQVRAIGALIQAFGWKEIVPIHENDEYGQGIMPDLVDMLQGINTRMPYQSVISSREITDDEILKELYKLKSMQTRVFLVHLWPNLGVRLFLKAKEAGMISEDYVWILTNGMVDLLGSFDANALESLQGVLGVKTYVPRTQKLDNFTIQWLVKSELRHHHLNVYGLWAYDAIYALAKAAEEVGMSILNNIVTPKKNSLTDLNDIRVSKIGPKLLQAVSQTRFRGLAGEFSLGEEGELMDASTIYQIINVIGNGWKDVGYWKAENGLIKDLKSLSRGYSTSKANIKAIIWPGDSLSVPKGWVISASEKKLRIGVPVKFGFTEFIGVENSPESNTTLVTGYCIDVFNAVVAKLPYYVSYEFIPFMEMKNIALNSYNDLTYEVYLGVSILLISTYYLIILR